MSAGKWIKMLTVGAVVAVGGPLFVQSIRPTDEELFNRYSPDLKKAALENRDRQEKEYNEYVNKLKEWSKSDKSIWFAVKEEEAARLKSQASATSTSTRSKEEERIQREEMRRELQGEK
ncbi:Assembly factor cbp4 [Talaromyces marneffei ATCC 18224]|uniref:Cytochrome b mRNA-processing protein 4 n=2 Tax=Talaromyces marneffei TaxID=37727 RepID=B6Q1F9_TALMQ|nr:uncharacterized protein EYB26_000189 [Talaromyces marneffei]EEA26822.1 conserved hypothetical protein [Talaromyces marneffei ATCC 18224]KAE8557438.1 hypothetical protein EYB25_002145 [Talaromyces marneffei]QGA12545.1 hypothetical protein EYB26_000189 [Talaromyces marneffei]